MSPACKAGKSIRNNRRAGSQPFVIIVQLPVGDYDFTHLLAATAENGSDLRRNPALHCGCIGWRFDPEMSCGVRLQNATVHHACQNGLGPIRGNPGFCLSASTTTNLPRRNEFLPAWLQIMKYFSFFRIHAACPKPGCAPDLAHSMRREHPKAGSMTSLVKPHDFRLKSARKASPSVSLWSVYGHNSGYDNRKCQKIVFIPSQDR